MELQVYRNQLNDDLTQMVTCGTDTQEEEDQITLARALGFSAQGNHQRALQRGYRALRPARARQLRTIFPTRYSLFQQAQKNRTAKTYTFDLIPMGALREIQLAKDYFSDIEIWTPEVDTDLDPIAVGIIYGSTWERSLYFPIARWGEALVPYRRLVFQYYRDWIVAYATVAGVLLSVVCGICYLLVRLMGI
jgi:hypothetical protein